MRPPLILFIFLLAAVVMGCGLSSTEVARVTLTAMTQEYNTANARVTHGKQLEEAACLVAPTPPAASPACVEAVISAWASRSALVQALYAAILDAHMALDLVEAATAHGAQIPTGLPARLVAAVDATIAAGAAVLAAMPQKVSP